MLRQTLLAGVTLGSGIVVGVVGLDGRPLALRAWGLDADDDTVLRVVAGLEDEALVDHLPGRSVAVTSSDVRSFRSHQVKGTVLIVRDPTPEELAMTESQTALFFDVVHEIDGNPVELLRRLLPDRYHVIEIAVAEIFEQSPGPSAGSSIGVVP